MKKNRPLTPVRSCTTRLVRQSGNALSPYNGEKIWTSAQWSLPFKVETDFHEKLTVPWLKKYPLLWWKPKIQFPCREALRQILSWAVWVQSTVYSLQSWAVWVQSTVYSLQSWAVWVQSTVSHFISSSYVVILSLHLCLYLLSDPFLSSFRLM